MICKHWERDLSQFPHLIKPDQKGYITGQYINEANTLLNGITDYTDREKKRRNYMLRVKQKLLTDVNDRAYSIVLKKKYFWPNRWIMMLLKSAKT